MTLLVVAEAAGGELSAGGEAALAAALRIGEPVTVLVMGDDCKDAATKAAGLAGVGKVRLADDGCLANCPPEACAPVIASLAKDHSHVMAASGSGARNWLPRAAALCGCPMVTDVTEIIDAETFAHPTYAGNAIETVRNKAPTKFFSIRATAFGGQPETRQGASAPIEAVTDIMPPERMARLTGMKSTQSDRPDLASSAIVVSAGRGVGGAEGFAIVADFAEKIGAALGATRAAVDAGYAPNDIQVGQTGKVVAPDLYIAVGISGAIQHVAGMKDSRVIVAINKDESAPIFSIADYGLVGDFRVELPKLLAGMGKA